VRRGTVRDRGEAVKQNWRYDGVPVGGGEALDLGEQRRLADEAAVVERLLQGPSGVVWWGPVVQGVEPLYRLLGQRARGRGVEERCAALASGRSPVISPVHPVSFVSGRHRRTGRG
jgi:hypothetical protein